MSKPVIQQGAIGVVFVFTVKDELGAIVDLSTATQLDAVFRANQGATSKTFGGVLTTDGTDGKFQYTTAATTDLDEPSTCWQRQGFVQLPGGYEGRTEVRSFVVKPNL